MAVERSLSNGVKGTQRRAMLSIEIKTPRMRVTAGPWTARRRETGLLQIAQHFDDLRVLGRLGDVVHVDVADDALFIDDDDGALADSFVFFPDAVLLRDFAFGMKVRQHRVMRDAAQRLC